MAIRHVITIQVAAGRMDEFVDAFRSVRDAVREEPGCEQYELFRGLDDPDRVVLLERWTNADLLERHMAAEQENPSPALATLVALWAPGRTPTIERFES
ncbi:MAG TPA: antibiotic biosynthesis monooxygenase family protein [Pseudonocardiaceae bacterium]|nr:antibiotic biosynthesis monooxygenase family protein [Pseudonocardiaceae bacterium]